VEELGQVATAVQAPIMTNIRKASCVALLAPSAEVDFDAAPPALSSGELRQGNRLMKQAFDQEDLDEIASIRFDVNNNFLRSPSAQKISTSGERP